MPPASLTVSSKRGDTLAVCESSAGGLISATLLAIPGASRFLIGGLVVYPLESREALLGISPADMDGIRPATEPYAALLAERCRNASGQRRPWPRPVRPLRSRSRGAREVHVATDGWPWRRLKLVADSRLIVTDRHTVLNATHHPNVPGGSAMV